MYVFQIFSSNSVFQKIYVNVKNTNFPITEKVVSLSCQVARPPTSTCLAVRTPNSGRQLHGDFIDFSTPIAIGI